MSRNGTRLWIPAGYADAWAAMWPRFESNGYPWPRTRWLKAVEDTLATLHPDASRADLNLTARSIAPFPLAAGHDVP